MISNSFGLEAKAQNFIHIKTLSDLSAFDSIDNKRLLILGAGTNVILGDYFNGTVVEVCFNDIEINDDYISVGAGVDWADLIEYCLINKLYGIENLTHIPGSVGAAPVQNIGAYGVEISSFINSIECFNLKTKRLETLNNDQCEFKYRDSIFKLKDFVILKVNFIFNESFKPILSYPALSNFLKDNAIDASSITPRMLSESVKEIRNSKLPDPKITPNVGSIFKNPIVRTNDFDHAFLDGHRWDQGDEYTKLSSARLIELIKSDLSIPDTLQFYEHHSLVLINNGSASFDEVINLLNQIKSKIYEKFNIELEIEPEIISS
jgi:UDP-N-acetylmuramate dehydrogenase|tara:strand:+ start:5934 stop:6893 length:960 start_codon:yes stop_codon:yes gene_type:complete